MASTESGPPPRADIVDGTSTAVQRHIRRGGLAGFEPVTSATLLTLFADQQPGFVFYDVGANIGLYSVLCGLLFEPRAVVAFEPTPSTARMARRLVKANHLHSVTVVEEAVGSTPGSAPLHLSNRSDASNSMVAGFRRSAASIDVPTTTIDRHVESSGLIPHVVKIDVETFEAEVLRGAHATLVEHRPSLVVEVLRRKGQDHGVEVTEAMQGLGYRYYRLGIKPSWRLQEELKGRGKDAGYRDWLLVPEEVDAEFGNRHQRWLTSVATCTAARNSRLPVVPTVLALRRSKGTRETVHLVAENVVHNMKRWRTRLS